MQVVEYPARAKSTISSTPQFSKTSFCVASGSKTTLNVKDLMTFPLKFGKSQKTFQFGPNKMYEITNLNFFMLGLKDEDSDFVHFLRIGQIRPDHDFLSSKFHPDELKKTSE